MPRVRKDTNRLVSFRVSDRLWEQYQSVAKAKDLTASQLLRQQMRQQVLKAEPRKRAA
jgi:hypothetical protein